jgi:IclR family transcriptional regulator, pca regulon regulatory protein
MSTPTNSKKGESRDDFVQSFARGLSVLRAFGANAPIQTIADVARRAQIPRPAARRLLMTLVELKYASFDGKYFKLTPDVMDLGYSYLSSLAIWDIGQMYLDELAREIHENCSIAVLENTMIVYVARVHVHNVFSTEIAIGTRLPAYATSMGRVLLAALPAEERRRRLLLSPRLALTPQTVVEIDQLLTHLDEVESQGFSVVDQELSAGLRSLAVPVYDASGSVVAALNVSTQVWNGDVDELANRFLRVLKETASRLASKLDNRASLEVRRGAGCSPSAPMRKNLLNG